jgi:tRNA(fMet)-specific endonuclease VapC
VIHLDTSFLVDVLREASKGREGPASRFLDGARDEELRMSMFVACELAAGAELSTKPAEEKRKVDRLCSHVAIDYPDERFPGVLGSLLAAQERSRGGRISTMDLLIATSAVVAGASLVTRNARDFARVPGLDVLSY